MTSIAFRCVTTHPSRLTADFQFGQRYQLIFDKGRDVYFIDDVDGRSVAVLPVGYGGEIRTRTDGWLVATERRKRGWAVVARSLADGSEAGSVSETFFPYRFKLRIGEHPELRLRANPLNNKWTITSGRSRLAVISDVTRFASSQPPVKSSRPPAEFVSPFTSAARHVQPTGPCAGVITTSEGSDADAPLALAVALTLEMIKADATIPTVPVNDGSGYGL